MLREFLRLAVYVPVDEASSRGILVANTPSAFSDSVSDHAIALLFAVARRVTLLDRHNYHLFQPLLYQVATASLSPGDIASPIRWVLRHQPNVRVLRGRKVVAVPVAETRGRAVLIETDGESAGRLPATFEILPRALNLRC